MIRGFCFLAAVVALLSLSAARPANAQNLDISWSGLNSGSNLTLSGGTLRLAGTIGQGEVEVMSGGPFQMVAGFWNPVSAIPCRGDVNGDREISLNDLAIVLANFGTSSGASYSTGDLTGDGAVALDDLATLLSRFGTTCPE